MGRLKCARCGKDIPKGQNMVEKICGRYVPVHRDCGVPYESAQTFEDMLKKANRDSEEKQKILKKRRVYR